MSIYGNVGRDWEASYPFPGDEPYTSFEEIRSVMLGRKPLDGLGRDRDDLLGNSPMMDWMADLQQTGRAELDLWDFFGREWERLPASVKAVLEERMKETAREEVMA